MYGRIYDDQIHTFEASGGLMHSSLVMQDRETDSYWSIMTGDAIAGKRKGTKLQELPVGVKMQWKDWVKKYPNTLVLSVNGKEHIRPNPYDRYFSSPRGFRNTSAADKRMRTKEPIYAFQWQGVPFAVRHKDIKNGKAFIVDGTPVFLFRPKGAELFYSTLAFRSTGKGFAKRDGHWTDLASGSIFDPDKADFVGESEKRPQRLEGFDTFWYNWSLTHPDTKILK